MREVNDNENNFYNEDIVDDTNFKLDVKNIALKVPTKSKSIDNSFWRLFWINIPKRESISDIRKEYLQVMEDIASN